MRSYSEIKSLEKWFFPKAWYFKMSSYRSLQCKSSFKGWLAKIWTISDTDMTQRRTFPRRDIACCLRFCQSWVSHWTTAYSTCTKWWNHKMNLAWLTCYDVCMYKRFYTWSIFYERHANRVHLQTSPRDHLGGCGCPKMWWHLTTV